MLRTFVINVLMALLFSAGVCAQGPKTQKPNFTGTWKVNFQKSKLQIPAPESSVFVVEHKEPQFRLTRTHVAQGKSDTFSIELTSDGKEVVRKDGEREIHARMFWEGSVMVFDTRIVIPSGEATNLVRYTMAKDGKSFTAVERFRGPQMKYDNVWVLEKE